MTAVEVLIATGLGICAGVFTGLMPGIHTNLVSTAVLSASSWFLGFTDVVTLSAFIISMAVVNTFLNVIPSIYLGAPDTETALSVLPGHRMLLEGRGYDAVKLSTIGSYFGMIVVAACAPLLVLVMVSVSEVLQPWIGWLLLVIVVWMIAREKNKSAAVFVFLLSGVLGLAVLNMNIEEPLFPLLSGLFGLSTLLTSLNESVTIPEQKTGGGSVAGVKEIFSTTGIASLFGTFVGFFPGIGPAQAAVAGAQILPRGNFLMMVGGIGSANMVASLVTFYALDKSRNGAIVAVRELLQTITLAQFGMFLAVTLISGSIAVMLTLYFAKRFSFWIQQVPYTGLCWFVILFIVVLVPVISGWMGVLVIVVSTLVGMVAPLLNVSRSQAMGCLLLPVILWFLV